MQELADRSSVFATMTIVPAAPQVLEDFHSHSAAERTLLVTIWELGEGVGPFLFAPLSERFGRLPVFHIGNTLALCCVVVSALSVNMSMLIAFRFLCGCSLAILTLGPTIVGDMFQLEERGIAMASAMGFQLIGEFVSPLCGSYIAQGLGWRWSVWLAAIVLGAFSLLLLVTLRETYAVKILDRKAARLNIQHGSRQYQSKHHAHINAANLVSGVAKPILILFRSPIILLISVYTAVTYALASLIFATLTEVMELSYPSSFSRGSVGLTFLSLAIGNLLAALFYGFTSDSYMKYRRTIEGEMCKPEARLVHLLPAAVLLPVGFLLYGWTTDFRIQYIVPLIGTCAIGFSMVLSILPTETYLVDVYDIHSASAIAAGVILRATLGAVLPLIGPALYSGIGYGWGNSVLALIGGIFVPLLVLLFRCGNWFRSKERLATFKT